MIDTGEIRAVQRGPGRPGQRAFWLRGAVSLWFNGPMTPWRLAVCLSCLGFIAAGARARGEALEAGVARVDITPPSGFQMVGYPDSDKRIATGARDPLYARVLVLKVGSTRLALVDLDLIFVFGPAYLQQLRDAAHQDVSDLLVDAIHTHSGPSLWATASSPEGAWETAAVAKVAAAVHEAAGRTVPVRLGVGYGAAFIGFNRLRIERDGSVSWYDKNWTNAPTAPVDPTVAVLRIDDMGGSPIAVLVNYACHPVVYGTDNKLYSADFPGVMTAVVEKAMGGKPLCFYLQGGSGNINPFNAASKLPQGAVEFCRQAGTKLGEVSAGIAEKIQTTASADPSIQVAEDTVILKPRWDAKAWEASAPKEAKMIATHTKDQYELPLMTILINRQIAIVSMPGEPFVDFQMQFRARCPARDCLFLGYSNGAFGYFPTIRAAAWGGYGASHSSTWIEVGAGERMLNQLLVRVYEMLGRLKADPEDLQK
jgi:neutral ceramidase